MRNYRTIANRNANMAPENENKAELWFEFRVYLANNTTLVDGDKIQFYRPTYCQNALILTDRYGHPSFYNGLGFNDDLIAIDSTTRDLSGIVMAETHISVGYTEEDINISDTTVKNIKATVKATTASTSLPDTETVNPLYS